MKIKKSLLVLALVAASVSAFGQEVDKATVQKQADAANAAAAGLKSADTGDKAWKFSGVLGLNAAATGLVNWAAGGNNNVNGVVYGKFRLLYHKGNIAWDSNLNMEYGLSWIDQAYDKFQKSSDNLNFTTKFGWEFKKTWYLTALAGFQSQFAYGRTYGGDAAYDPIISKCLAPSYTDISVGIDWKPNDIFSVYLSPVAGRLTTVYVSDKLNQAYSNDIKDNVYTVDGIVDEAGFAADASNIANGGLEQVLKEKYAVYTYKEVSEGVFEKSYDKNLRAELGLSFKGNINYSYKDLKVITSLGLFTPYAWNKTEIGTNANGKPIYFDNNRRFGNFDVDWDTSISYQFFNCLQVTLSTSLKYYNGTMIARTWTDKAGVENTQSAERVQFKGVLGIGVGYSF